MSMKRYNFFLGEDQYEALGRAAERRRVSRSQLLRDILDRVFKLTPPESRPTDDRLTTTARTAAPEASSRVAERVD